MAINHPTIQPFNRIAIFIHFADKSILRVTYPFCNTDFMNINSAILKPFQYYTDPPSHKHLPKEHIPLYIQDQPSIHY